MKRGGGGAGLGGQEEEAEGEEEEEGEAPKLDFSIGTNKAAGKEKMQGPPRVIEARIDPAEVEAMAKASYEASMLKVQQSEDEAGKKV